MIRSIFDHIYVIHLSDCKEREAGIRKQFEENLRLRRKEYQIFQATSSKSKEAKKLMKSRKVKKFPGCFRCHRNRCKCENNILTYPQIANWCSFRNVWKDMIKNKHKLCMICEDDVCFHKRFTSLLTQLLLPKSINFKRTRKPILIMLNTHDPVISNRSHKNNPKPKMTSKTGAMMSNACYAINLPMARLLLAASSKPQGINHTSDVFTHKLIPRKYPNKVKRFKILPIPSTQLSFCGQQKSTIRPKHLKRSVKYVPGKGSNFYLRQLQ